MRGFCAKCHTIRVLTRHHVFPSRYYPKHNQSVLMLCEECHREIERILPHNRKLHKDEYLAITGAWLRGATVFVQKGGRGRALPVIEEGYAYAAQGRR